MLERLKGTRRMPVKQISLLGYVRLEVVHVGIGPSSSEHRLSENPS